MLGSSSSGFTPGGVYTIAAYHPDGSRYTKLNLGSSGTVRPDGSVAWQWDCTGDLPGASQVVNENRPQIRSCYERRLKVNNVLQGNMTLKLKVGGAGKVAAAQVTGSLRDPEVFACVRKLAQTWTFPVPTGGSCAVVEAPFQFSPKP